MSRLLTLLAAVAIGALFLAGCPSEVPTDDDAGTTKSNGGMSTDTGTTPTDDDGMEGTGTDDGEDEDAAGEDADGKEDDDAETTTAKNSPPGIKSTDAAKTATMAVVVYRNADGKAVCPVMDAVVDNEKTAAYQDYEGKRYYFCCDGCPQAFKEDPAKYASK